MLAASAGRSYDRMANSRGESSDEQMDYTVGRPGRIAGRRHTTAGASRGGERVRPEQGDRPAGRAREVELRQPAFESASRRAQRGRHDDGVGADDRLAAGAHSTGTEQQLDQARRSSEGHGSSGAQRQPGGIHPHPRARRHEIQTLQRQRRQLSRRTGGLMFSRRSVATAALAVVIATSGALSAGAQGFGGGPPPYTPKPGDKDLKAVLYNWTWHMGMLRGQAEPELVATLEYQA